MNRFDRVLALALVLAAVALSCGGGGNGNTDSGAGATTTTSRAGEAGDGGSGSEDGGGTDAGALDAADAGEDPAGVDPRKPVRRGDIPAEGRYEYEYSEVGKSPSPRSYDVGDVGSGDGWVRQLTSLNSETTAARALVVWLADRYYQEVEQRAREDQVAAPCVWDPGFVVLELPLDVGASWESDSTCRTEASTRRRTMEAKVTGMRTVEVGATSVETFVIEQTTTTTTDVEALTPITTVETETATDLYSADRYLLIESSGTTTATVDGAPRGAPQVSTLRLRSLSPEPPR